MRQSEFFLKIERQAPKDEKALNAQLLIRAGFIEKLASGIYSYLPLGFKVLKNIEAIVRREMEAIDGEEILMPALQPKANWLATGRWEIYDTLFRFKSHYSKTDYVLGPTHEEIISPLAKRFIASYKDLPKYLFQIQTKFRDEKRAKSGLLRSREFLMKDLYSFHVNDEDLDRYYEIVQKAYERIFTAVGLGDSTYLTFASGGTFSKYSHEFQTVIPAGEDTIHLCKTCQLAVNHEIINDEPTCPQCGQDLEETMAAEVGNIFKLKTKYSTPFGLTYKDETGKDQPVLMGCYGIGLSRLLGVLVEKHHDKRGIIWPEQVAPFRAHLLELNGASAASIYDQLQKQGIPVLYDERSVSAGEKFAFADLIGLPLRLVVSPQTGDRIEVKARAESATKQIRVNQLGGLLRKKS